MNEVPRRHAVYPGGGEDDSEESEKVNPIAHAIISGCEERSITLRICAPLTTGVVVVVFASGLRPSLFPLGVGFVVAAAAAAAGGGGGGGAPVLGSAGFVSAFFF